MAAVIHDVESGGCQSSCKFLLRFGYSKSTKKVMDEQETDILGVHFEKI